MPDPLHPQYGTSLPGLVPVDTEQLRRTIEGEVRRTLNELAPGVDPGIIFDILVDVTVEGHKSAQIQVNMTTMHEVTYSAPLTEPATTSATGRWLRTDPPYERFRNEFMAEFLPSPPTSPQEPGWTTVLDMDFSEAARTHDDMVDSMRAAILATRPMDQGQTGSCTSSASLNAQGQQGSYRGSALAMQGFAERAEENFRVPFTPSFLGRRRQQPPAPPAPPHPIVEAILRAKQPKKPVTMPGLQRPVPKEDENLTRWERIRANYALFE